MIDSNQINSFNISTNNNSTNTHHALIELDDENENNLLLDTNKQKNIIKNNKNTKLSKKNEITISIQPYVPKKTENNIICFSRRRKFPKNIESLTGYLITLSFFIIFTILITISLSAAKSKPNISKTILKNLYNYIIFFVWLTSIVSIVSLTDAASADPGRQRGTPISKTIYDIGKIKKIVGGKKYSLKYCTTCNLIRDIRTFHCNTCGNCIEKHDHHCNYLSNCVGVYNYKKFFIFLINACIHVNIMFLTSFHFIFFCQGDNEDNEGYEWVIIFMTLITVFGGFFEIFTVWMLVQHIIIIIQNRTTREFIKQKEFGVYNKGFIKNCKEALCNDEIKEL